MNNSNIDFMIKDFLKQNYNIEQFTKIIMNYKEKGLVNEETEKIFYEFLFNKAKHCPEFLRKGDLLETLLWCVGDNDPKVLFRLFKAVVNLSLGACYDNFPMAMEKYIISVLNPDKFLEIDNERFVLFNLTLIDSKFNEFVELVIDLMMGVDAKTKENLLMDWSIFGTRSYLEKFRDPDFILRFFGVIQDESYKLQMETLHNTISNIYLNENQQFEFIQRCRARNNYEENVSKISSIGKKFEKFFYPEPVTSAVLDIVLKFNGEKERKVSEVSLRDEMRYSRYISCALYCLDTWEKRTENTSAKMFNSVRKRIVIESLKLVYENDSSEWFSYLEKLIDKELDRKYRDDEGEDVIPYYATESTTIEIPDYEGIDNAELALEKYSKTSGKIAKVERGIYRPFKKFKIQADKVDSEANKVLKILKKMVAGDKHTEIIEGKKYTPITLVTRALGTIVLFKFNKVAAILAVLVGFALDKETEAKERVKIVADLETELTMLNEKIEDARAAGDNEAKYAMMRTKAEIEKTIKKIKYGIEAGTKSGVVTNDYMNYGEK